MKKFVATLASAAVLSLGLGATAMAATVPPGTPPTAVVYERNSVTDAIMAVPLASADPMTGRFGYLPIGDAYVYYVNWTHVTPTTVSGTGRYYYGHMGFYDNGPVAILLKGSHYKYNRIWVTMTQHWYGHTTTSYPPYGTGTHHSTAHVHLAVNDPTTNLDRVIPVIRRA
jgi:hypothetical protein